MKPEKLSSRDWFGKASAGLLLGFFIAVGLSGIFARFGPGEVSSFSIQHQFTMWLIAPLLAGILSFCFLFRSGLRAWGWLGITNLVIWGLLYI